MYLLQDEVTQGNVENPGWNTALSRSGPSTHARLVGSRDTGTVITPVFAQSLLKYFQYNIAGRNIFRLPVTNITLVLTVSPNALTEMIFVLLPPVIHSLTCKH